MYAFSALGTAWASKRLTVNDNLATRAEQGVFQTPAGFTARRACRAIDLEIDCDHILEVKDKRRRRRIDRPISASMKLSAAVSALVSYRRRHLSSSPLCNLFSKATLNVVTSISREALTDRL